MKRNPIAKLFLVFVNPLVFVSLLISWHDGAEKIAYKELMPLLNDSTSQVALTRNTSTRQFSPAEKQKPEADAGRDDTAQFMVCDYDPNKQSTHFMLRRP